MRPQKILNNKIKKSTKRYLLCYLNKIHVLPTPESPMRSSLKRRSYVFFAILDSATEGPLIESLLMSLFSAVVEHSLL